MDGLRALSYPWLILTLCLLLFQLCSFDGQAAQVVTSSGLLAVTTINGGRPYAPECSTNGISVTLDSAGHWAFEIRPIHGKGDVLEGKEDVIYLTYDGSNSFFCQFTEAVEGMKNGRPGIIGTKPLKDQTIPSYVSVGSYPYSPFDGQKRAQILWLMYGAGKYILDSKLETMPLPWLPVRYRLDAYGFRLKYELLSDPPYIPTTLQFIRDSKLDIPDNSEYTRPELDIDLLRPERLRQDLILRKTKWIEKSVAGRLKTTIYTNLNGLALPLASEFREFIWTGEMLRLYTLSITNVIAKNAGELPPLKIFHPPVLADLYVFDSRYRMRDSSRIIDSINYNIKKGEVWPSENSEFFKRVVNVYLNTPVFSASHKLSNSPHKKRIAVVGFLFIMTVVPLLLALKFSFKHQKQKAIKNTIKL